MRLRTRGALFGAVVAFSFLPAAVAAASDETPVADVVINRDLNALRTLLAKRADVNGARADGSTALHWAVYWNNVEAVDLLLRAGANVAASTRLGATPLFLAVQSSNPALVARLLEAGVDVNAPFLSNGETALMVAARAGNMDIVTRLLDAGAAVDAKDSLRGTTALAWAAEQNHTPVVKLLLARGADPKSASKVTTGPARGGDDDAPDDPATPAPAANANARGGVTALMVATRERATDTIKALLDGGAAVNQQSGDGTTALIIALQNGDADTANLLLDRGADVNIANGKGWAPLFLAVKARTREIGTVPNPIIDKAALLTLIKRMVDAGANVNARTSVRSETYGSTAWLRDAGATPLLRAAYCADIPVMKYLLEHGADPQIMTLDKTTTLMALAGVGYGDGFTEDIGTPEEKLEAMKMLVDMGVPINAANNDQVTALHGAAHKNFPLGIRYLVEQGADMTAVSQFTAGTFIRAGSKGQTVLDWATGVMVNMQSSSYKTEAVDMVNALMKERGVTIELLTNTRGGVVAATK